VLLSKTTVETVPGLAVRDLGGHVLKDFPIPEELFQLLIPGLPDAFAPLRAQRPTNLPAAVATFVGRDGELRSLAEMLDRARLLTITGAGGSGKTRTAVELARSLMDGFGAGVWFADLSSLTDPAHVAASVAAAIGSPLDPSAPVIDSVLNFVGSKRILIVLDNCEHLIDAAASVAGDVLAKCPEALVVATSREPLAIAGEQVWPLTPLKLPDPSEVPPSLDHVLSFDAVRLFVDRAASVRPGFRLDEESAGSVIRICRRLDGIPLAIELAAARVSSLSPREIDERLDDRFALLTGSGRGVSERQRTLRAAIQWSYRLMSEDEQDLFRNLGVFAGGCRLEAAEAVAPPDLKRSRPVLDVIDALVNKSMLVVRPGTAEMRYSMLDSVLEFARAELTDSGDLEPARDRHLDWMAEFAERAENEIRWGPADGIWLGRVEAELDNVRSALHWSAERGWPEAGARLATYMAEFWFKTTRYHEGRRWTEEALERSTSLSDALRARLTLRAGFMAYLDNDHAVARARIDQALTLARRADEAVLVDALNVRGWFFIDQGSPAEAKRDFAEGIAIARRLEDAHRLMDLLGNLAAQHFELGKDVEALRLLEESLRLDPARRDWRSVSALSGMARVKAALGDIGEAATSAADALALARGSADLWMLTGALTVAARVAIAAGDLGGATDRFVEALQTAAHTGELPMVAVSLDGLARVAELFDNPGMAVFLLAQSTGLREHRGIRTNPLDEATNREAVERLRSAVGADSFDQEWRSGLETLLEDAIERGIAGVAELASERASTR
jgi:predicted ATPase